MQFDSLSGTYSDPGTYLEIYQTNQQIIEISYYTTTL